MHWCLLSMTNQIEQSREPTYLIPQGYPTDPPPFFLLPLLWRERH